MTSECHLCEQAQRVIQTVVGRRVSEVDILEDSVLLARYGQRIPVLQNRSHPKRELDWPFTRDEILQFIQ